MVDGFAPTIAVRGYGSLLSQGRQRWLHVRSGTQRTACPSPSLAAVDLAAHQRDGLLIDTRGIPFLDGREVGLTRLVSSARAPAMRPQKVRGRVQRVGSIVEIAGAVGQDVLRHKLRLADFAMHGAARAR